MMEKAMAPFSIYAESTPNPATMKFVSNRYLITNENTYEFNLESDVKDAPLAARLLQFPFINNVFISKNFVTLTKVDAIEWQDVINELRQFLGDYLNNSGSVLTTEESISTNTGENNPESPGLNSNHKEPETDLERKIIDILDEYIKPAVESDGGAIVFESYDEGKVNVVLQGSCSGCPSSTMTLKSGIEELLKQMLPEDVNEVVAING